MQKSFSHDTKVFSASNQIIVDDNFMTEMHLKANKLRAKAFAHFADVVAKVVIALFAGLAFWFKSKVQKSNVMNQLYSMDDRALADIGLTRGDIEGVINGTWTHKNHQPLAKNLQLIQNNQVSKTTSVHENKSIAA
jgi:uncharacterized protein YjiS (DUF1127 family)